MNKKLIIDYTLFVVTPELIQESIQKNNGRLIVNGPLQRANMPNQNKRIYPKKLLMREVEKYQTLIKERRALGELDHPDSPVINLSNVSHNILKTWWDNDTVMGQIEVLGTPAGNILKKLFEANITLGISSRGMGSIKELGEDVVEVDEDFDLVGWDFVSNPSTHGAFMIPVHENINLNSEIVCRNKVECLIRDIITGLY